MARKLVIASHGGFAQGALDAAVLIAGDPGCEVQVFSMQPGETPLEFAKKLEAEITQNQDREFVILCDLFGASVCNVLYPLTRFPGVKLFTDFNLRLLIEVMTDYKEPLSPSDMETIAGGNRDYVQARFFETAAETEDF